MASREDEPKSFKVTDRRSVGSDASAEAPPPVRGDAPSGASESRALPPVDFQTFLISLGSSVLLHLGHIDGDEAAGAPPPPKDLVMAQHTIEVLAMLQEKTKGNLSAAEERLLGSLLYDLRLRFVEASQT